MAKAIKGIGYVLLVAGIGIVLVGYAGVAVEDGIWAAVQLASPYNISNFLLTIAAIAPGILFLEWGKRMQGAKEADQNADR